MELFNSIFNPLVPHVSVFQILFLLQKDGGDPLIIQRENSKDEILGVLSHSCGKMLIFTNISVYDTLIKKAKEEYLAMSCD